MKTVYRVVFKSSAAKELKKLPKSERDTVKVAIDKLANNPWPYGCRKLVNDENSWRIRVGNYRVIYTVYRGILTVRIVRVGHRREVYR